MNDSFHRDTGSDSGLNTDHTIIIEAAPERRHRGGLLYRIGAGSLTVSIVIHGLFVLLAVLLIWRVSRPGADGNPDGFLPAGGGGGGGSNGQIAAQKRRAVTHAQPRMRLISTAPSAISLPNTNVSLASTPSLLALAAGGGGPGSGSGMRGGNNIGEGFGNGNGWGITGTGGPGHVSLPPAIRSRCSPAERSQKMRDNGGSDACETAVKRSLKWLKEKQNPDGSWGESHKGGMTGLALLAFLGHCETPDSPVYGENVLRGLSYLMEIAQRNQPPFDGIYSTKPATNSSTYEHGIAAYAMGEMYSFSKLGTRPLPGLRESFEKAAGIIISRQNPQGAWGYRDGIGYDPYGRDDLSVTGWQFQALKAARHTGLTIPGLPAAVRKVEKYLESTQTADGGFGDPDHAKHYNQWNLTGAALLGLQTLGGGNAGRINRGVRWLVDQTEKEPLAWNRDCDLYTWYYNTQALFQKGGTAWKVWNDQFQPQVLENQADDGSYRPETSSSVTAAGTVAAGGDSQVYRVCLCTLMLEVYYRYLKVGDRGSESATSLLPRK